MESLHARTWDAAFVNHLVGEKRREDIQLDYKQELPKSKRKGGREESREFLCDIAALANAEGGAIVYGVSEETDGRGRSTGMPAEVVGLPELNAGEARLRLMDQILRGIEPNIPDLRIEVLNDDQWPGPVLVVRVPKSHRAPHMIITQPSFYRRHVEGNQPMGVYEVRAAFSDLEAAERIPEAFRRERAAAVLDTSYSVAAWQHPPQALFLMHVVPLNPLEEPLDTPSLARDPYRLVPIPGGGSMDSRLNFDGILVEQAGLDMDVNRTQLYGDGRLEYLSSTLAHLNDAGGRYIDPSYEPVAVDVLRVYWQMVEPYARGMGGVAVVMTWLQVGGYRIAVSHPRPKAIDRASLFLPDVGIIKAELDDFNAIAWRLKPSLDRVWQACGIPSSGNFRDGTFKPV